MLLVLPLPVYSDFKEPQLHESIRTPLSSTLIAPGNPITQISLSQAEQELIHRESGGNPLAKNPYSSASGLFQMIDSNKVYYGHKLGIYPYTSSKELQIELGRAYIADRYGTAEAALTFHNLHGHY